MDIGESFPSAPVRYAFDDADSEDEYDGPTKSTTIRVELSTDAVLPEKITLVLGLVGPGSVFLYSAGQKNTVIGRVLSKQEDQGLEKEQAPIMQTSSSVVYIPFSKTIPQEDASIYTKSIVGAFAQHLNK
ncbi:hypothetical protein DFQ28_008770 [Apophysomyces sp. BC1034]|nr:hypothetical protein DFQ30_008220 [Apophysomyces sp. BC1015]KAG0192532.1 hypothetical protein DFQ28_008770 [Apophysomyces sp. BC1034]